MPHLSRILVAVDYSKPALAAFDHALALARIHTAELIIVHAVPVEKTFAWRANARGVLLAKLRARAESYGVAVNVAVQHGEPASIILLHARSRRPDVVVVGTHQRTGLNRLRTGSIAKRVTLRAMQPVLVVPARARAVSSFEKIVVAVDFSEASNAALRHALAWSTGTNRRLTVVNVASRVSSTDVPLSSVGMPPYLNRFGVTEYQRLLIANAWRRLNTDLMRDLPSGMQVRARVVTGDAPTEIARLASHIDADLIVLGVRRRNTISQQFLGSTATRLMRVSDRPILAVPESTSLAADGDHHDRSRLAA
jgi:nucleotide-binding universal stress UspA family protein